jgi:flagella basal body P-ring formation protein FlgA
MGLGGIIIMSVAITSAYTPTLQATRSIAAGAFVRASDVAALPCKVTAPSPLRYDRVVRVARAARSIAAGECIAGSSILMAAIVPGQKVRAVTKIGAVKIERAVEALQAAGPGERLFVRASDGAPYTVRYEEIAP